MHLKERAGQVIHRAAVELEVAARVMHRARVGQHPVKVFPGGVAHEIQHPVASYRQRPGHRAVGPVHDAGQGQRAVERTTAEINPPVTINGPEAGDVERLAVDGQRLRPAGPAEDEVGYDGAAVEVNGVSASLGDNGGILVAGNLIGIPVIGGAPGAAGGVGPDQRGGRAGTHGHREQNQ